MSTRELIKAVLEQHPLEAGEGYYSGWIVCGSCERVLGNPTEHLTSALVSALVPDSDRPAAPQSDVQASPDRRESAIGFEPGDEALRTQTKRGNE